LNLVWCGRGCPYKPMVGVSDLEAPLTTQFFFSQAPICGYYDIITIRRKAIV
jgi:hypothetical protein